MARRGRPLKPLDPDATMAAWLGAELRARRLARQLTLRALGDLVGYSPQHISEVERARTAPTQTFIAACDDALRAGGRLSFLLSAALQERELARRERAAARRREADPALRCPAAHSEVVGEDDVEPVNRRGMLGEGAAAALGAVGIAAAPVAARDIDPELPAHWTDLLNVLADHNQAFGPRAVRRTVRRELGVIAEHREVARGGLRAALMRVEACWSEFGAWLAHDCGDARGRDALLDRALRLAREADYPDMIAWAHARSAQWSDAPVALRHAEAGLRTPAAGAHTRAMCAARVAHAHARMGDADSAERSIAEAEHLVVEESRPLPPPDGGVTDLLVRRWEANCWALLKPVRAIAMYDAILRDQPRTWVGGRGLYLAYLANACADAGELDRARQEGAKALAIAKQTRSTTAARELHRLHATLAAAA